MGRHGTWVKLHEDIHSHPKTIGLADAYIDNLNVPPDWAEEIVVSHLHRLACWCLRESETGSITHLQPRHFARILAWPNARSAPRLLEVWRQSGFIDIDRNGARLHDFEEFAKDVLRKRRRKDALSQVAQKATQGRPEDDRTAALTEAEAEAEAEAEDKKNPCQEGELPDGGGGAWDRLANAGPEDLLAAGPSGKVTRRRKKSPTLEDLPPLREMESAEVVFHDWVNITARRVAATRLTPKRLKAVKARLAEGYSITELRRAIEGCALSPHNQGQNDRGTKYDDLELICRSGEQVERFIEIANNPPRAPTDRVNAERDRTTLEALQLMGDADGRGTNHASRGLPRAGLQSEMGP